MKNTTFLLAAFLVALAAAIILPVGPAAVCTALTVTGVLSIFLSDYSRETRSLYAAA